MSVLVGRVGLVIKGAWDSSVAYASMDVVTYNNSTYIAKQAVPAGTLPTNTTYWELSLDASLLANKVTSATSGNVAGLNGEGNLTDSGWAGAKDTTSISGNPISISGLKSNQLAIDPVITFEPIQAGSGTPSPSNVRAISGYNTVEIISANGSDPTAQGYVKISDISEGIGQTVYVGSLDVRSGKLTVTHGKVDLGTLTWNKDTSNKVFYAPFSGNANRSGDKMGYKYISDRFVYGTNSTDLWYNDTTGMCVEPSDISTTPRIYVRETAYDSMTAGQFTTAMNGALVVYELAAPLTIQLTPHEISLLKDYAYVSTNGTNIALDYHNGELASLSDVAHLAETYNLFADYIKSLINE